jgi:hypothetical protein
MERQKIELYQERTYGEKLSATFAFVSENMQVLLKFLIYFLLPVSLVQAVALNGYFSSAIAISQSGNDATGIAKIVGSMGLMVLLYFVGTILLAVIVYALMHLYGERENRLQGLTWTELKPVFVKMLKRCMMLILFSILASIVFTALLLGVVSLHPFIGFVVALCVMMAVFPLALVYPIYFLEDNVTIIEAISKAFRLGFATWGGIFGIFVTLAILVSIVGGIISLPWAILNAMKMVMGANGEEGFVGSIGYSFIVYLFGVVQCFANYFLYALPLIGLAYQYGHAAEKIDHVTVESDIDRFEQL